MTHKNGQKNKQCRDAIVFLLLSAILIAGVMMVREKPDMDGPEDIPVSAVGEHSDREEIPNEEIPDEVSVEADRLAEKQWEHVSDTFGERNYVEYRLDSVDYVFACHDVEDETFEVYGIACSYRREGSEEWEQAENAANSYFVFRRTTDGALEWQCDILSYHEPQTEDFEDDLHDALMGVNEQYMFKLLADESLDKTLEQSLQEYMLQLIPGDGFYFGWKRLALESFGDSGQVYGILLFHSASGSPLIYSEETERYGPAIYSTYLLPIRVSYQKDSVGRYVVTECWEPSEETYEQDIRACFPADTVNLVLENLDQYATDLLIEHGVYEGEKVFGFFPGGPIWPTYSYDKALNNTDLCGIAAYYPEGDIYYKPTHDELIRRFYDDPVSLLNGLGLCNKETRDEVCAFLSEQSLKLDLNCVATDGLTPEGEMVFKELKDNYNTAFNNVTVSGDVMAIRQAFKRVVLHGDPFVDIFDGTISEKTLGDLYKVGTDLEMQEANKSFAVVDLDGDGVAEVVLSLAAGNNEYPYGFAILRYGEDGAIRCYHTAYREFCELKTNGMFTSSGGANDWAICSVDSFGLEDMTVDKNLWCQSTSKNGDLEVCFYHRGVQIDERTFFNMVEEHEKKDGVLFNHISEFEKSILDVAL